jgi:hypothetical protein
MIVDQQGKVIVIRDPSPFRFVKTQTNYLYQEIKSILRKYSWGELNTDYTEISLGMRFKKNNSNRCLEVDVDLGSNKHLGQYGMTLKLFGIDTLSDNHTHSMCMYFRSYRSEISSLFNKLDISDSMPHQVDFEIEFLSGRISRVKPLVDSGSFAIGVQKILKEKYSRRLRVGITKLRISLRFEKISESKGDPNFIRCLNTRDGLPKTHPEYNAKNHDGGIRSILSSLNGTTRYGLGEHTSLYLSSVQTLRTELVSKEAFCKSWDSVYEKMVDLYINRPTNSTLPPFMNVKLTLDQDGSVSQLNSFMNHGYFTENLLKIFKEQSWEGVKKDSTLVEFSMTFERPANERMEDFLRCPDRSGDYFNSQGKRVGYPVTIDFKKVNREDFVEGNYPCDNWHRLKKKLFNLYDSFSNDEIPEAVCFSLRFNSKGKVNSISSLLPNNSFIKRVKRILKNHQWAHLKTNTTDLELCLKFYPGLKYGRVRVLF